MDAIQYAKQGRAVMTDRKVLHICPQVSPEAGTIESSLADAGVACQRVSDFYAGMAALVGQGSDSFEAVLVCLPSEADADREFFHIAGRRYRSSPIYVYGVSCDGPTAECPLPAGARRRIDAAEISEMFKTRPPPPSQEPAGEPAAEGSRLDDLLVEEIVRPLTQQPAGASSDAGVDQSQQEQDRFQPEQFDVLRDQTARTRQKPARVPEVPSEDAAAEADSGSLITPEEMRALLGDESIEVDDPDPEAGGDEA